MESGRLPNYVTCEYIGTKGCTRPSPLLYAQALNSEQGKSSSVSEIQNHRITLAMGGKRT